MRNHNIKKIKKDFHGIFKTTKTVVATKYDEVNRITASFFYFYYFFSENNKNFNKIIKITPQK
jgi:hypothetical protein